MAGPAEAAAAWARAAALSMAGAACSIAEFSAAWARGAAQSTPWLARSAAFTATFPA